MCVCVVIFVSIRAFLFSEYNLNLQIVSRKKSSRQHVAWLLDDMGEEFDMTEGMVCHNKCSAR